MMQRPVRKSHTRPKASSPLGRQNPPGSSPIARVRSASPAEIAGVLGMSQQQNLDNISRPVLTQSKLTPSQPESHPCERRCHRPLCCAPPDGESPPELPSPTGATSDRSCKNKAFVQLNVSPRRVTGYFTNSVGILCPAGDQQGPAGGAERGIPTTCCSLHCNSPAVVKTGQPLPVLGSSADTQRYPLGYRLHS